MQDKGINSTFKKIIYESSEMVFLADDTYPYSIFYTNESFEQHIGESLDDRSLVGLGLDINAYVFKEELILTHRKKDYSFKLELPQDSGSNYFLFYKGREEKTHGLPTKKEAYQFFTSKLELLGIGKHDYLTYVNPTVLAVLGFEPEELLQTNLCALIHEEDLKRVQEIWKSKKNDEEVAVFDLRFKGKNGVYRHLECSVQFNPETFFVIARDNSLRVQNQDNDRRLAALCDQVPELSKSGTWKLDLGKRELTLEQATEKIISELGRGEYQREAFRDSLLDQIGNSIITLTPDENGFTGTLKVNSNQNLGFSAFFPGQSREVVWGVMWDDSHIRSVQLELAMHRDLWMDSPEAMLVVESDGRVVLANRELKVLFGMESSENVSHLRDLSAFLDGSFLWTEWLNSPAGDKSLSHFSALLNGTRLTLEVGSRKSLFNQKEYTLLSFRNISEKITLEQRVEASRDFLMNLTEQVPGGLYQLVMDSEGQMNFSFLSKGIGSVLGFSREDIQSTANISDVISKVHPQDLPQVIMTSVASARKMQPWQCQFRVKSANNDQDYRWVLGAARPQALDNGEMVWYGYLTDISLQKEFETKLDEARLAAEKANQTKSDFLSMISHELRTPLNAISGSVYSLFHEGPTESQKAALHTINFAVDNLIIMINDLLDFQKIEAGKLTIEPSPINLKTLMEQVIKGLSFHAKDSKNKLELHMSDGLDINVRGDKTRLSQVMNNLITNALKFTHEGNVDVRLEFLGQIRNKVRVNFSVTDTGIGIAPEHQQRIFNDFDQVKPTFNSKYGGTGLGLSITKKLLNLMGGSIALDSEPGKGSHFHFELEFEKLQDMDLRPSIFEKPARSFDGLHLLMAEDNEVNSLVLGKIIKKWGYTYNRVHNGKEAVEAARVGKYDCILMDIQMPEMDGFEATLEIKKFSDTPVIALTAAAKLEILDRIDECEFEGFVAKPIDAAELLKTVREVVEDYG